MEFQFIKNYPAILIPRISSLVVADFHIGLEYELLSEGIRIPNQAKRFGREIDELVEKSGAERLIILGDIKHKLLKITKGEEISVLKFLNSVTEKVEVFITLGNHDTGLEKILSSKIHVASSRGFRIDKFGFFHGHAWPSPEVMKAKCLFMGHIHPSIFLTDEQGKTQVKKVFVIAGLNKNVLKKIYGKIRRVKLVILPAYNNFLGGSILNKREINKKYKSPLWKECIISEENSELYLLNGTYLGNLKKVKN